jgi:hypothetical protein
MTRVTGNGTMIEAMLAVLLLSASAGVVAAQDTSSSPGARAVKPSISNAAEQAATARATIQRGSMLSQRITTMLEEARREADIIRVTCLSDKLTQVNANMRTAQARLIAFESASDPEQRKHQATVLGVLGQKFQALDQEANSCVGQDIYDTGSTKVQTEIDTAKLPFEEDVSTPVAPPPTAIPDLPRFSSGIR